MEKRFAFNDFQLILFFDCKVVVATTTLVVMCWCNPPYQESIVVDHVDNCLVTRHSVTWGRGGGRGSTVARLYL